MSKNPTTGSTPLAQLAPRSIRAVAIEIYGNWATVNYAAKPYLQAMQYLTDATSKYGRDDAKTVVIYFLANATSFRGEKARALKEELKAICNIK